MDLAMLKSQREELKKQQGKLEAKLTVTFDTDTDAGKIRNLVATHQLRHQNLRHARELT